MKPSLRILLSVGLGILGCAVGYARIGETEKQCEERYGKPEETDRDGSRKIYRKSDMVVLAHFHEGICDYIMFSKVERDEPKELSENERDLLLKANGAGNGWKKVGRSGGTTVFETTGGEFRAQHDLVSQSLTIFTRESAKRKQDAKKAEEEKKLKGF